MDIEFNNIPASVRTPGTFIEFDNSRAGGGIIKKVMLIIGQRLASGSVAANVEKSFTSVAQAELYWGRGAMLTEQVRIALDNDPQVEMRGIALDDNPAGVAATGSLDVTAAATATGTLTVDIDGITAQTAITSAQADTSIATAIAAIITAETRFPVTAVVNGVDPALVDLTCKWKGETGNDIPINISFVQGGNEITGVPITITAMAGGSGNPDISSVIAAMGDEWYHTIVTPYTDAANMTLLEAELERRWGPMVAIASLAFAAKRGTQAALSTYGNTRNDHRVSCMGTGLAPQSPALWAAANGVVASDALADNPSRQLRTLALRGIRPPQRADIFTREERDILLYDGISTYTVDTGGIVRIDRQITMYQHNTSGIADDSYLDIMTPALNIEIRFRQVQRITSRFARSNLAEDDEVFVTNDSIVTPSLAKAELLALYREFMALGWCEDFESYKKSLKVFIGDGQRGGNRNRLNIQDQPNYVNNLMIWAQQTQFIQ